MNAGTILIILQIIGIIQALQKGQGLPTETQTQILTGAVHGKPEEVAAVNAGIQKLGGLDGIFAAIGGIINGLFGKK